MAGRPLLPVLALSAIGLAATSLGLGYGLAQYTLSGMDPFYATARSSTWQERRAGTSGARSSVTEQQLAAVFEPDPQR